MLIALCLFLALTTVFGCCLSMSLFKHMIFYLHRAEELQHVLDVMEEQMTEPLDTLYPPAEDAPISWREFKALTDRKYGRLEDQQ